MVSSHRRPPEVTTVHVHLQILYISAIVTFVQSACFMEFDSTAAKVGNFSSPRFPEEYPNNVECYYTFKGQESETLKITFMDFDLEPPFHKGCLNDFVDISTISVADVKQLVGRYCGRDIPVPLQTMKPRMEIIFKSNHAKQGRGFYGMYQFTDERFIRPPPSTPNVTECGGTLTGVGGDLTSPGYPDSFPKDIDCSWLIRVDYDKHIYIRVLELQLKGSIANCGEAELAIYDGYSNFIVNPNSIKRFCGDLKYYKNTEDKTLLSTRNRLLLRLKTTVSSPQRLGDETIGFRLVWTAVSFQETCSDFNCPRSQYCLNSEGGNCKKTRNYCIDNSLVCDGLPNCSGEDSSDETRCHLPLLAGLGTILSVIIVCLLVTVLVYRRRRFARMEMDLADLERSPSSRQPPPCAIHCAPMPPKILPPHYNSTNSHLTDV